jgi:Fe-S-cluster containining protein
MGQISEQEFDEFIEDVKRRQGHLELPWVPLNVETVAKLMKSIHCGSCGLCCEGLMGLETGKDLIALHPIEHKELDHLSRVLFHKPLIAFPHRQYLAMACPCVFYDKSAPTNRCRVYVSRPFVCRTYPVDKGELQGKTKCLGLSVFCPEAVRIAKEGFFYLLRQGKDIRLG